MSDNAIELTEATFESQIDKGITLVDFWAPWCGPCKAMGPIIDSVAQKVGGKAVVAKLDIDEARGVANKYGIQSIPAIFVFKDGMPVKQLNGMQQEEVLISAIEEAIAG